MEPTTLLDRRVREFDWLCRSIASEFFVVGADWDDVVQEARIGLWKGLGNWRPDGGASLRNHVALTIRRHVQTAVLTATRKKHGPLSGSVREVVTDEGAVVSAVELVEAPEWWQPEVRAEQREGLRELVDLAAVRLSGLERRCLVGVLDGVEYTEIAARLGVSVKSVDNALQRARRKLADGGVGAG